MNMIMIKKRYIKRLIIILGLSSLLIACLGSTIQLTPTPVVTATPPGWIFDWLENPVCLPPCWETIQPGSTSINNIQTIQQRYPDMSVETEPGTSTIQMIGLYLSIYDNLPVQLIMSKFGSPDYVRLYKCDPNKRCETHLIFADIGMVLNTYPEDIGKSGDDIVKICDQTSVFQIFFIEPGLNSYYNIFSGDNKQGLNEWKGCVEYSNLR